MEYREFRAEPVGVNGEGKLHGVALPFNSETTIGDPKRGGWREEAAPGLCKKSINDGDVLFLAHHDMHMPLARTSAGNLTLREDTNSLRWEASPVDTSYGRDIRALAEAGVLGGVSIGFNAVKDEWRDDDGNPSDKYHGTHRILREIKLIEISAVTKPAYKDTSIMARDELLAEREARAGNAPGNGKMPYGKVKYADPGYQKDGKKRYPIDTERHIQAAWSYIHQQKNAAQYTASQLASIMSKIKAAMKRIGSKPSAREADLTGYCPRHGFTHGAERRCENPGVERRMKKGSKKRVLQIDAELKQAISLFGDVGKLPDDAQRAVALVSSAAEHAGHICHNENLNGGDISRSSRSQEPDASTPEGDDDFALTLLMSQDAQRSRELGFA